MDVRWGTVATCLILLCSSVACNKKAAAPAGDRGVLEPKPECANNAIAQRYIVRWNDGSTSIEHSPDKETLIKEVIEPNQDDIEFAEPDMRVSVPKVSVPNVSMPKTESAPYALPSSEEANDWGQRAVSADQAWQSGADGHGVIVAVVDSGVDINHPQLKDQIAINPLEKFNGIDDDNNGFIDDVNGFDFEQNSGIISDGKGHGTHVSGIIAAAHNGIVLGVAPKAKILPIDFMNDMGNGSISNAILGIEYAVSRGAKVINASWGGTPCSKALNDTIQGLANSGVIFVVAAGNSGQNIDYTPEYPAAFGGPTQITVGASTVSDITAYFSNFGDNSVQLMAPGVNILSTFPGNQTEVLSGTSMASPFVAGAAALLMSSYPNLPATKIREAIVRSIDSGPYQVQFRGRLNIQKALNYLKQ